MCLMLDMCLSSTLVAINARLPGWLQCSTGKQKLTEKRINPNTVALFPKWNTNTINFCHSFDCARGKESIIFFNDLCKPIETISMLGKSTHLQFIPQQSTQSTANLPLQTCEKNQQIFLLYDTGVDFSSRNNFANLVPLQKLSVASMIKYGLYCQCTYNENNMGCLYLISVLTSSLIVYLAHC